MASYNFDILKQPFHAFIFMDFLKQGISQRCHGVINHVLVGNTENIQGSLSHIWSGDNNNTKNREIWVAAEQIDFLWP